MRRLALAVLVAALFGCATAPAPKFVGNSYHNNKYKFSLEKPSEWQQIDFRKIPEELIGPVPPDLRKALKIFLFERSSGSIMFIAVEKADCEPQQIPMVARMTQQALVTGMQYEPGAEDVKRCSGVHMTEQDACIEALNTEGGVNFRVNFLMKLYPVGSQAKMLMVGFVSPEAVYDVHFPAFLKVVNSLRCGEEYRTVRDMTEVAEDVYLAKEVTEDVRFVKTDDGIIYDTKTDLEWYVGPDRDMTWKEAEEWTNNLSLGGGGWRMPTYSELSTLYQDGRGTRNMSPLFETTGWWVWGAHGFHGNQSMRPGFSFDYGSESWEDSNMSSTSRAFAVRSP